MKWLSRVKTGKPLSDHASKPRKPGSLGSLASLDRSDGGFLGSLALLDRGFQKLPLSPSQAANDQDGSPERGVRSGVEGASTAPLRNVPRGRARDGLGLDDLPVPMSTVEIERFMARVERFTSRGLPGRGLPGWAENLADRLLVRDREGDDRRMCIECRHCTSGRSCGRARAAGLSHQELGALAVRLQRCPAFAPAISTQGARP